MHTGGDVRRICQAYSARGQSQLLVGPGKVPYSSCLFSQKTSFSHQVHSIALPPEAFRTLIVLDFVPLPRKSSTSAAPASSPPPAHPAPLDELDGDDIPKNASPSSGGNVSELLPSKKSSSSGVLKADASNPSPRSCSAPTPDPHARAVSWKDRRLRAAGGNARCRAREALSICGDWDPELDDESSGDCSASSSRKRASSFVILAWSSCVRLVRFFS